MMDVRQVLTKESEEEELCGESSAVASSGAATLQWARSAGDGGGVSGGRWASESVAV